MNKESLVNAVQTIHSNVIKQIFFLFVLVLLGWVIINELYFLTGAFLGAVTLYVILMHPMKYLVIYKRWKTWLAALVLMLTTLVLMVIPIIYFMGVAIDRITPFIKDPNIINGVIDKIHIYLVENYNIDLLKPANIDKVIDQGLPILQKTLGGTFSALGNIFLMYFILYFLLVESRNVEKWLKTSLPLKKVNGSMIIHNVKNLVYSNALGIPIVALIQGLVGLIGYWLFGVEEFLLMAILTAISSVVPVVGTLVVYLPLAIFQFIVVSQWQGIAVALWGLIVIGSVDNIARFLVQKRLSDVHPLITLLGVILGINLFGFIGIIFGPLLISIFFILVTIYRDEFVKE